MLLAKAAKNAARRFAKRECLVDGERRWSFADFDRLCDRVASGLRNRLAPGDRVALFMANRAEYLLLQMSIERAGLVRVPINARSTPNDVALILDDSAPKAIFHDGTTADQLAGDSRGAAWRIAVDSDDAESGPSWYELTAWPLDPDGLFRAALDDLCSINYTSGSSGSPKGVMLSHRNWLAVARNMLVDRDMSESDRVAHIGPLTHASGSYFMPWFLRGACSYIIAGGDPQSLVRAIEAERITVFTCVPTALTRIVNLPGLDDCDLTSLRAIGYGAEPIPGNTLTKAIARFGPILTQNYGQTEAYMTITMLPPADHFQMDEVGNPAGGTRIGCIGYPYTFVDVVLRAPDGRPVSGEEVGEITVRSDHVMMGYWGMPNETTAAIRDEWLWTGDLAQQDSDGRIYLVGRRKDMLISGGFNIYPGEIEAALTAHPAIMEAAAFGVPSDEWGEMAVACVVPSHPANPVDTGELMDYCKPLLGFRTPKRILLCEQFPKTPAAKVDKRRLRDMYLQSECNG